MTSPKQVLCFVLPVIPAPDGSDSERVGTGKKRLFAQAVRFAEEGHDVHVLTESTHSYTIPNLKVRSISLPDFYQKKGMVSFVMRALHLPLLFIDIFLVLRSIHPAVVHAIIGYSWLVFFSLLSGVLLRNKTIAEATLIGASDAQTVTSGLGGFFRGLVLRRVTSVVNISPALRSRCLEVASAQQCVIIANPVDTDKFTPLPESERTNLRKKLNVERFKKIVSCVAIIRPRKGIREVLEIFERVHASTPNCGMVFVGSFEKDAETRAYYSELKNLIKERGLGECVLFTGHVENVSEWMQVSDIFLFASEREGLGNVVLEAMSTGLPVVMKHISQISDFIITDRQDGFIFKDQDEGANIVGKLLSDIEYAGVSERARKTILSRFDTTVILGQYRQLYGMLQ